MRTETGTFELRDNDMFMRELTYAETSEVAGGIGQASVMAIAASAAGSTLNSEGTGSFQLATSNTTALADLMATFAVAGPNNAVLMQSQATVV
jgi:hypothetical protein